MSLKRSIFYNLGSSGGVLLCGLINSILSARVLQVEGKGQFALYMAAIEVGVVLLLMGVNVSMQYFAARKEYQGPKTLNTAIAHSVISALVFGLVIQAFFAFGKGDLVLTAPFNDGVFQLLIVLHFLNQLLGYSVISLLNSYKEFVATSKLAIATVGGTTLIYIVFFILSKGFDYEILVNAYYVTVASVAGIRVSVGIYLYMKLVQSKQGRWTAEFLNRKQLRAFFNFGLFPWMSFFMIRAVFKLDFWFINYYEGVEKVGLYSLASNVGEMIYLVPNSIGIVVFSYIADASTRDHSTLRTAFLARIFLWVMIVGATAFSFVSSDVIAWVYSDSFEASGYILNLLMLGIVPFSLANLLQGYLSGANMVKQIFYSSAIGFAITLVLDALLVPLYGTTGAAVATVIAYVTMTIYLVWCFKQATKMPYRDFLLPKREDLDLLKRLLKR